MESLQSKIANWSSQIDKIGNSSFSDSSKIDNEKAEIQDNVTNTLNSYYANLAMLSKEVLDSISSQNPSIGGIREYPTKPNSVSVPTGYGITGVEVTIKYSGVKSNGFFGFGRKRVKIEASLDHGIEREFIQPLILEIPKGRGYEDEQKENERRIANYLKTVVEHTLIKSRNLAEVHPKDADLSSCFERELVFSIARLFQNNDIITAYALEIKKPCIDEHIQSLRAKAEEETVLFKKRLDGIDKERVELEKRIQEESKRVKPLVDTYAEEQKKRIQDSADKLEESLKEYHQRRLQELESLMQSQLVLKRRGLENEIGKLTKQRDLLMAEVDKRKQNFRTSVQYLDDNLKRIFPDYDNKNGDEEDVNPQARGTYVVRIAEAVSSQNAFQEQHLIDLIQILANSVRKSAGKKFTRSDMDGIVNEAIDLTSRLHPDNFNVLKDRIYKMYFRKRPSIQEVHNYLSILFRS